MAVQSKIGNNVFDAQAIMGENCLNKSIANKSVLSCKDEKSKPSLNSKQDMSGSSGQDSCLMKSKRTVSEHTSVKKGKKEAVGSKPKVYDRWDSDRSPDEWLNFYKN